MLTLWKEILIAAISGIVGGIAGGGLINTYLNLRRFQREQEEAEKEDRRVAIDHIRSVCSATLWNKSTVSDEALELHMFRNNLKGTVREYIVLVEFAIRNLTDEPVIITRVEMEEPGLPTLPDVEVLEASDSYNKYDPRGNVFPHFKKGDFTAYDAQAFYNWETKKEKERTEVDYATLDPKNTITMAYLAIRRFCALRKLSRPPEEILITVRTTGGHEVKNRLKLESGQLRKTNKQVDDYPLPDGSFAQIEAQIEEEEEIPF